MKYYTAFVSNVYKNKPLADRVEQWLIDHFDESYNAVGVGLNFKEDNIRWFEKFDSIYQVYHIPMDFNELDSLTVFETNSYYKAFMSSCNLYFNFMVLVFRKAEDAILFKMTFEQDNDNITI